MQILVVDDNQAYADILRALLSRQGYRVGIARSGAEALDTIRRTRPGLVLIDLYLGGNEDGDAVCRRIKGDPDTADLPVIMMSGGGRKDEEQRCTSAGCNQFLTKPIRQSELLLAVSNQLLTGLKSLRVDIRLPVTFESGGSRWAAFSANLSLGGMFIEVSRLLQPGTEMLLEFALPGQAGGQPLLVRGRVAWVNRPEGKIKQELPVGMGIQFTKMAPEAHTTLGLFLGAAASARAAQASPAPTSPQA